MLFFLTFSVQFAMIGTITWHSHTHSHTDSHTDSHTHTLTHFNINSHGEKQSHAPKNRRKRYMMRGSICCGGKCGFIHSYNAAFTHTHRGQQQQQFRM